MTVLENKLRKENELLREQVRQLKAALVVDTQIPAEWGLTSSEATLLMVLAGREMATYEAIITALYGARPGDPPSAEIVKVWLHRLRRKLAPHGATITTIWGRGCFLDADTRQRLRAGRS